MDFIKIKHILLDRGLTQAEVARRLGISPSTLNEIFKGKRYRKGYKYRAQIAAILGVEVSELFGAFDEIPNLPKGTHRQEAE